MEVTRLVLVLQILWSTRSTAEHRYSENGFDAAQWLAQYASSPFQPRSIQDNIYFNITSASTTAKPENTSEQILNLTADELTTELAQHTASPLNEKEIVSSLLRYGQHHRYVLKNVLRGLKLLRDSSISDVRQCVREALFKANEKQPSVPHHATQTSVLEHEEEKYIVKALLTEPNYMEFCVQKTAHKNMRKQVYDSLMTEVSSLIKNRQVKQLVESPNAVITTIRTVELEQPPTSTPADPIETMEGSTIPPTTASSNGELQETSTTPNAETTFEEMEPSRTLLDSTEVPLSREDINIALNKEMLNSGVPHQVIKPYKPYTANISNKIRSKIPLIYHHGTISIAPRFNYVPYPSLSVFTVREIDPEVMAKRAFPIYYSELYRAHLANEETHSTTTEALDIQDNEDSTHQATGAAPQGGSLRTVKKMLTDDEFKWPGPFAMERIRIKRSPTKFSLDVQNMKDQRDVRDTADEDVLSTKNSRAPKEYLLPLMISEAIPVISVPGEIPDLGKEINVIKEFSEPASTVEPPIVLKVQRVPTHVDTSEFWNTREDDHIQENSSRYPFQGSEEVNIQAFLEGLRTTESSLMRESKMFKEETSTDSLVDNYSQQTITVTESFLEINPTIQENNKNSTAEVLLRKEMGELSNERVPSPEKEEVTNFESIAPGGRVDGTSTQDYAISHTTEESVRTGTEIKIETPTAVEETIQTEGATEAVTESIEYGTAGSSDEGTESASTATADENVSYATNEPVSMYATTETEISSDPKNSVPAVTTTFNHSVSDITGKPIENAAFVTTVPSSESNETSEGTTWDPDFDFVVLEEFSSSHIAKDDIPIEYMDYPISLLGELAKSMTELTARSTGLKSEGPASSQIVNETQVLFLTAKQVEEIDDNKDFQPTSMVTRHLKDNKEKKNIDILPTSFQKEAEHKEPSGLLQGIASSRSRRQAKQRELPSEFLKLFKDKDVDTNAVIYRRGSSASANQIPTSPEKFSKSRTQNILMSLNDKRRKGLDEDAENETDDDNSVDENASILELIDVNRVSHILDKKH